MSRSLSWIDPEALAASLARAGVDTGGRTGTAARRPGAERSSSTAPEMPQVYLRGQIPSHLAEFKGTPAGHSAVGAPPSGNASSAESSSAYGAPSHAASSQGPAPARHGVPAVGSMAAEPTTVAAAKASAAALEEVEIEAFEPPASRLHARLEAFMEWVERQVHCHEIFIVDEEGLVLMERNSDPTLIAVSSYFLNFNERIRSSLGAQSAGSVSLDLKGGQTLHVVQAETRLGPHALGFTISQPLRREVTESFRSSLPIVFGQEPS